LKQISYHRDTELKFFPVSLCLCVSVVKSYFQFLFFATTKFKTKMKKHILVITAGIVMLVACKSSTKTNEKDAKVQVDSTQVFNLDTAALVAGTVYYQCPMDPEEISDKPGVCPKCGMDLEPMTKK
jgi:hypothetical protein